MKKCILAILVASLMLQTLACGSTKPTNEENKLSDDTTSAATEEGEYVYPWPTETFGGQTITILNRNTDGVWGFLCNIDMEETNGDAVNDALYNRCRNVEDKLDVVIDEINMTSQYNGVETIAAAQQAILTDDGSYDIMYLPLNGSSVSLIYSGAFLNLLNVDSLQLDQAWWYSNYNDVMTINDALYGAMGGSSLFVQESIRMLLFNHDMMDEYDLEYPYQLVRDGKWTLDVYNEYVSKVANLNGDSSATFKTDGNVIYGMSNHGQKVYPWLCGAGELGVVNENGEFTITCGTERWYNVIEKLAGMFTQKDAKFLAGNNTGDQTYQAGNFFHIFLNERSLFGFGEVAKLEEMRSLEFDYGVLPFPKYDEAQEKYYTNIYEGADCVFLPTTLDDPEKIGTVLDALAYLGETEVMPIYRENAVEQKGLRNEDSIEMLQIISDSIVPPVYLYFSIGTTLLGDNMVSAVINNKGNAASSFASNETAMNEKINEIMENWN